jgi:hypothetical protein
MKFKTGSASAWVAAAVVSLTSVAVAVPEAQAATHSQVAASAHASVRATVSHISVTGDATSLTVHWKNPSAKKFEGVMVRVARGQASPANRHAGRAATLGSHKKGHVSTSASVKSLSSNTIYSFSIWTEYSGAHGKASWTHAVTFSVRTPKAPACGGPGSSTPVAGPVTGVTGKDGAPGATGAPGSPGAPGTPGAPGSSSWNGLAGVVTDATNSTPLQGATATLTDLDTGKVIKMVTTDDAGAYSMTIAGSVLDLYQVCFSDLTKATGADAGYLTKCLPAQVGALTDLTKSLPVTSLDPASGITGLVSGGLVTGLLQGVVVTATNTATGATFSSKTDSNGSYSLLGLPVGTYTLGFGGTGVTDLLGNVVGIVGKVLPGLVPTSAGSVVSEGTSVLGLI